MTMFAKNADTFDILLIISNEDELSSFIAGIFYWLKFRRLLRIINYGDLNIIKQLRSIKELILILLQTF